MIRFNYISRKKTYKISIIILLVSGLFFFDKTPINIIDDTNQTKLNITPSATQLKIVATITIIQDIVEKVVGESIPVVVSGKDDPHTYEPSTSQIQAMAEADIIIRLGDADIEPWWEIYFNDINHPGLKFLTLVKESMMQRDPLLPGNEKNPHMWLDPYNIKIFVSEINKALCSEDPTNAAFFSFNSQNYLNELNSLIAEISIASKNFNGLKLVQNHPAFFYFFKLLKIETIIYIEEGEDKEPSAEHIASVIDAMQNENCRLIIITPQRPSSNVYEIARSTNSKIGLLSDLLNVEVDWNGIKKEINSYVQLIKYNLWALKNPTDPPPAIESIGMFIVIGIVDIVVFAILIIIRKGK